MEDKRFSLLAAIGNTPLIKIGNVYAKLESVNPSGSIKDRVALEIIEAAEREGELKKGDTIVEASSGNTGISLAMVAAVKSYRMVVVMPENMSEERKKIIRAFGGELILTSAEGGIEGAVQKTMEMAAEDPSIFVPQQFENPKNPEIHYLSTGPEIWEQMDGQVEFFVAGVGSGGTLGGVGKYLKEQKRQIKLIAVEPHNSAALLGHEPGLHQIQGIGDGFIPAVLDTSIIDGVITVSDEDAIETTRRLAKE